MSGSARVVDVEHLGETRLRVAFSDGLVRELDSDGLVRELDFAPALSGFLTGISNEADFARVTVDPVAGTLCWPGGIDFDPDVLHGDDRPASGDGPDGLAEHRLHGAG